MYQFGLKDAHNGMIFEEFYHNAAPQGWNTLTAGVGTVNYNYNGVSRFRLVPGVDAASVATVVGVVQGAYGAFNAEVLWENVLGKTFIGLCDNAANLDAGFAQDSATYGDEKLRVVLRTGAGLQVFDTGVNISSLVNDWIKLRLFVRGGTGLLSGQSAVFWKLNSKKGNASGVFTPGGAIVNPTTGRFFRFDALSSALVVVDRVCIGGANNFGL